MKLEKYEIKRYGSAFLTAPEAARLLHISTSHAYKVIHRLNQELKAQGFLTIAGRISQQYLLQRTMGKAPEKEAKQDGSL
ncbi:MAG: hypothetical protein IJ157_08165 [Clostridia bacterium]|nr:hypothetical protein [Clostridia bacterium]